MTGRLGGGDFLSRWLPAPPHDYGPRLLIRHFVVGFLAALVFWGLILAFDFVGFRTMFLDSGTGVIGALLLLFGLTVAFGSVAMGVAIMTHGDKRE